MDAITPRKVHGVQFFQRNIPRLFDYFKASVKPALVSMDSFPPQYLFQ